jgi:hypothetical protein
LVNYGPFSQLRPPISREHPKFSLRQPIESKRVRRPVGLRPLTEGDQFACSGPVSQSMFATSQRSRDPGAHMTCRIGGISWRRDLSGRSPRRGGSLRARLQRRLDVVERLLERLCQPRRLVGKGPRLTDAAVTSTCSPSGLLRIGKAGSSFTKTPACFRYDQARQPTREQWHMTRRVE